MKATNIISHSLAFVAVVSGSVLSHEPILALLSLPLGLVGMILCVRLLRSSGVPTKASSGHQKLGLIVVVVGAFLVIAGSYTATGALAEMFLAARREHPIPPDLPLIFGSCFVGPLAVVLCIKYLTGQGLAALKFEALYWFSIPPAAVVVFAILYKRGVLVLSA